MLLIISLHLASRASLFSPFSSPNCVDFPLCSLYILLVLSLEQENIVVLVPMSSLHIVDTLTISSSDDTPVEALSGPVGGSEGPPRPASCGSTERNCVPLCLS